MYSYVEVCEVYVCINMRMYKYKNVRACMYTYAYIATSNLFSHGVASHAWDPNPHRGRHGAPSQSVCKATLHVGMRAFCTPCTLKCVSLRITHADISKYSMLQLLHIMSHCDISQHIDVLHQFRDWSAIEQMMLSYVSTSICFATHNWSYAMHKDA